MDTISAALGLEYGSEEEMRALAERLRKEKRAADVFALSPTFEKQAAAQQQNILSTAETAGLARAKELERVAAEKRQKMSDEAAMERTLASQISSLNAAERQSQQPLWRPEDRYVPGVGVVKVGQFEGGQQMMARPDGTWEPIPEGTDVFDAIPGTSLNKAVQDMSQDAKEATGMLMKFQAIHEFLSPYKVGGEKETPWGEIPGTEALRGKTGIAGAAGELLNLGWDTLKGDLKGGLQEMEEAQVLKAAVAELANLVIREQSGLTQTKGEIERVRDQLGQNLIQSPEVALKALQRLQAAFESDLARMPERERQVVDSYIRSLDDNAPVWETDLPDLAFPEDGTGPLARAVAPVAGGPEQTKTINGVTYVKHGGQWYQQTDAAP